MLALVPLFGEASSAIAQGNSGFPEDIVVSELASGELDSSATAPATLLLERVVLPARGEEESRKVGASELLYVEGGTLRLVDGLGLTSTVESGSGAHLRAGAIYSALNGGSDEVTFLRLSLTAEVAKATPAPVMATPVADDGTVAPAVTPLAEFSLTEIPASPATLFLDRAAWEPGVDSGPYTQNGPIGMLVESGTLTISSPSGIDGELSEGNPVLLPAGQELRTRNNGEGDAVALLFGVIPADGGAIAAVPPTPTPSPIPSPTSEPTETPLPSETPQPSPTPSPTTEPTPKPTSTPAPTPTPPPAAGSVLYEADTSGGLERFDAGPGWNTVDGMLVSDGSAESVVYAPYEPGDQADYAVEAEIQFNDPNPNPNNNIQFGIIARDNGEGSIRAVYWDGRPNLNLWAGESGNDLFSRHINDEIAAQEFQLDSEWHKYRLEVDGNQIRLYVDGGLVMFAQDNRYLEPGLAGLWVYENAQINVRAFRIVMLGGEITGLDAEAEEGAASSELDEVIESTDSLDATSLLPAVDEVPGELVETGRRTRTLVDVADNYTDAAETTRLFTEWGWQQNAVASFALPSGQEARSGQVNGVYVSIHQFSSADGARAALDFSLTEQAAGTSLQEVNVRPLGEYTRALYGPQDYGNETTLLTQQGGFLIRVSVAMLDGDPTAEAESTLEAILEQSMSISPSGGVVALMSRESGVPGGWGASG